MEKAMSCDVCASWVHIKCAKVPDSLYNSLNKAGKECTSVKWFCEKCETIFDKLKEEIRTLDEKQKELERKQTEMEVKLIQVESEMKGVKQSWKDWERDSKDNSSLKTGTEEGMEQLKEEVNSLKKTYSEIVETKRAEEVQNINLINPRIMKMEVSEALEREKRKNNLVIFGIQETGDEMITRGKVNDIVKIVGIEESKVKYFGRVGRNVSGGKDRVVRIVCEDAETKRSFLKGANRLKVTEGFERVYISQDLTKVQQVNDKKLRDKLRDIRVNCREAKISNGEIIVFEEGHRKILFSVQN